MKQQVKYPLIRHRDSKEPRLIPDSILEQSIKSDIISLMCKLLRESLPMGGKASYYFIRLGTFFNLFLSEYPLKYQRKNKILIDIGIIREVIRKMGICSHRIVRRKYFKRLKIVRRRIKCAESQRISQ